jgi:hypothetical protein
MWEALRYGWEWGAPVTPLMEEVFEAKRRATRAVLSCFHVASGLSQGMRTPEHKAAWSAMGHIPLELIDNILLLAGFEIPESLRRGLPKGRSLLVQAKHSVVGDAVETTLVGKRHTCCSSYLIRGGGVGSCILAISSTHTL